MGVLDAGSDARVPRLDFELTPACDHRCGHCYNVWGADADDPQGGYPQGAQLATDTFAAMMTDAVRDSGAEHITLTGGEPLLRKDALELVAHASGLVPSVQLITNGSHVTPAVARHLAECGLRSVQLTLLSADRDRHDRLKWATSFDDTLRAAVDLRDAGVPVQVCFVALAENWRDFPRVLELAFALGVRSVSYNRMSAAGGAIHRLDALLPTAAQVEQNLAAAEHLAPRYGIRVATAMPIPPCLIRLERYPSVRFGFCSVGSKSPNITIDAQGNVRSCNLSSHVMGNVREQAWADIMRSDYLAGFRRRLPAPCRGCRYAASCQGGCKESAFAAWGELAERPEPFIERAIEDG